HSGSPSVDVRIEFQDGQLDLVIRDYGKGIAPEKLGHFQAAGNLGVGLTGMRERVTELGGRLQIISGSPGILVRVTVPIGDERIETTRPFKSRTRTARLPDARVQLSQIG